MTLFVTEIPFQVFKDNNMYILGIIIDKTAKKVRLVLKSQNINIFNTIRIIEVYVVMISHKFLSPIIAEK